MKNSIALLLSLTLAAKVASAAPAAPKPMAPTKKAGLSTHVLDTTNGRPGSNIRVRLFAVNGEKTTLVATRITNADGRVPEMFPAGKWAVGRYQLVFDLKSYFEKQGVKLPAVPFLEQAVVRFGISDAKSHYHVPVIVTPYSYSTYRGS